MFFTECARIAEQHPDLAGVFEQLDSQLRAMGNAEVIRSGDLASFLNVDPNQMRSVLDMFTQEGVLRSVEMIECPYCQMAALRSEYQEALDEDDEYRCTSCDRPLTDRTIQIITAYRRGEKWREISNTNDSSRDTGLPDQGGAGITSHKALTVPRTMGSDAAVEALLALKGKKGWTMEELARGVGTTARTLQGFKNRRTVRSSVFRTMAKRLGITPEDLLSGNVPGAR